MKKTLNALFCATLALAMVFTFASCANDDNNDAELNIAGNTYVLSQEKEVTTSTDGSTQTTTMTMPSVTQLRIVYDLRDKTSGQSKVDMTITKGSPYTTRFNTFIIDGVSYVNDSDTVNRFLASSGFTPMNDTKWAQMTSDFSNTITINKDGTWRGWLYGASQTGTYRINTGKSNITVYTAGQSDSYDVGYSDGGKTLTLTEEDYDDEDSTTVYTMTFSRQ